MSTTKQSALVAGVKSAKTTATAVIAAVAAILVEIVMPLTDKDDATSANWGLLVVLLPILAGLLVARDANKTSAESGAE